MNTLLMTKNQINKLRTIYKKSLISNDKDSIALFETAKGEVKAIYYFIDKYIENNWKEIYELMLRQAIDVYKAIAIFRNAITPNDFNIAMRKYIKARCVFNYIFNYLQELNYQKKIDMPKEYLCSNIASMIFASDFSIFDYPQDWYRFAFNMPFSGVLKARSEKAVEKTEALKNKIIEKINELNLNKILDDKDLFEYTESQEIIFNFD